MSIIDQINDTHNKLYSKFMQFRANDNVRDNLKLLVPYIKSLYKEIENIKTTNINYKDYRFLIDKITCWNSLLCYYNLPSEICNIESLKWYSPKIALSRNNPRKKIIGCVVSDKMDKTVVIKVNRLYEDPKYKKTVRRSKKYKVHDANNICRIGDVIIAFETRKLSKTKHFLFYRKLY